MNVTLSGAFSLDANDGGISGEIVTSGNIAYSKGLVIGRGVQDIVTDVMGRNAKSELGYGEALSSPTADPFADLLKQTSGLPEEHRRLEKLQQQIRQGDEADLKAVREILDGINKNLEQPFRKQLWDNLMNSQTVSTSIKIMVRSLLF